MARIPVVQEPSVRPEGLPTAYQRPFATPQGQGAGFGELLDRGAGLATQYVLDAREKGDAAQIQGAWGAGQDLLNKQILDPEKGYTSLRGKDAMDAREKVLGDYNKGLNQINEGLTPEQQTMFAPHLRTLKEQGFTHAISHESVEMERYAQGNFKGNVDATMETMQQPTVTADPASLKGQVDNLYQAGIDEAKRRYGKDAGKDAITSVVTPMLQQAALGGMQAALVQAEQSGNPEIAKNAFDVLGKYLLTNHQKQIGGMVDALTAKVAIQKGAQDIIGGATDSVMVPGGDPVARVNGGKVAASMASLKDDTPHLSEIQDAVEKKQARLGRVWDSAAGTVFQRVEGAAMAGGGFDLDRASPVDKEWLRQNAPDLLLKLQKEDERGDRTGRALESKEAWSALAADMAAHPDVYKELSVPEFTKLTTDQGVGPLDRIKALSLFTAVQKAGQSEKINTTVHDQLLKAMPRTGQAPQRDKLQGPLLDAANKFVEDWKAGSEGKLPPTEKIRAFIDAEMASGTVKDTGRWWDDSARRIEYETNPAYKGKEFRPANANAPQPPAVPVRGALPVQAATPVAPARPADTRPRRTVNGETRVWNGSAWVKE